MPKINFPTCQFCTKHIKKMECVLIQLPEPTPLLYAHKSCWSFHTGYSIRYIKHADRNQGNIPAPGSSLYSCALCLEPRRDPEVIIFNTYFYNCVYVFHTECFMNAGGDEFLKELQTQSIRLELP